MCAHRCCQGMRSCRVLRSSMRKPHAGMEMTEAPYYHSNGSCFLWVLGLQERWHTLKQRGTDTETSHRDK